MFSRLANWWWKRWVDTRPHERMKRAIERLMDLAKEREKSDSPPMIFDGPPWSVEDSWRWGLKKKKGEIKIIRLQEKVNEQRKKGTE